MRPNFEWVDVCYEVIVGDARLILQINLDTSGKPTGRGAVIQRRRWTPDLMIHVNQAYQYTAHDPVRPEHWQPFLDNNVTAHPHRFAVGALHPDLRLPGFDMASVDLIPITEFPANFRPRDCSIRYRNLETRKRVPRPQWGGMHSTREHGPIGQPRAGFSPKQFIARYAGGGYFVPEGRYKFVAVGTGDMMVRGESQSLRRTRGWRQGTVTV